MALEDKMEKTDETLEEQLKQEVVSAREESAESRTVDAVQHQLRSESVGKKNDFEAENEIKKNERSYSDDDIAEKIIDNANTYFLVKILSPEISQNELSKRRHKIILIIFLAFFLIIQFISVFVLSQEIIEYICMESADIEASKSLLTFMTAYITSVVVELIAILNYIVKNVFDTSLVELAKIFKNGSDIEEQE